MKYTDSFSNLFRNMKSKQEEDDDRSKIGAHVSMNASIKDSVKQAGEKYYKPDYNPRTRKQFYDDPTAHKRTIDHAFADGKTVKDPYTGKELYKKQRDAKIKYGENWQEHAAEADHIEPINEFMEKARKKPFVTTEDCRDVVNDPENMQTISRKENQGSKGYGKGGSTQEEWRNDKRRMEGVEELLEPDKNIEEVKQKIRDVGKEASQKNQRKLFKRSVNNAMGTAHEAGKSGATNAGVTAFTMSGIMNIVSVIKGEKTGEEAVTDTVKAAGKAAVTGYALGGGMTVVSHSLSYSGSEFIQALAKNNVPGNLISAVIITGDTIAKWGNGEITTQECLLQLGDKGVNLATMGYSMAVGQALIPIPIVGGAVGALVGSMLTSNLYNALTKDLRVKQMEHEERMRVIEECNAVAKQAKAFRLELEAYCEAYFKEYKEFFDSVTSAMYVAYETGDTEGVIAGANEITRKLGGKVYFDSVDEFCTFLDSDEVDIF